MSKLNKKNIAFCDRYKAHTLVEIYKRS